MQSKPIFQSKTVLFNAVLVIAAFIPGAGGDALRAFIAGNPEGAAAFAGVANLLLRWITKDRLTLL